MKNLTEVTNTVYESRDVRKFYKDLRAAVSLRDSAIQIRDKVLPTLFALEIEEWRERDHPNEQLTAAMLEEESLFEFLITPDESSVQDYFYALWFGDWEQFLKEYLDDNAETILETYRKLFDD